MNFSFRIRPHRILPGVDIVEILEGDNVVGTITPQEFGIKVISAHAEQIEYSEQLEGQVVVDDGTDTLLPIPVVFVNFVPGPWTIQNGRLIKLG